MLENQKSPLSELFQPAAIGVALAGAGTAALYAPAIIGTMVGAILIGGSCFALVVGFINYREAKRFYNDELIRDLRKRQDGDGGIDYAPMIEHYRPQHSQDDDSDIRDVFGSTGDAGRTHQETGTVIDFEAARAHRSNGADRRQPSNTAHPSGGDTPNPSA